MTWPGWTIPPIEALQNVKNACVSIVQEIKKIEKHGNDPYQMRLPDVIDLLEELYKSQEIS